MSEWLQNDRQRKNALISALEGPRAGVPNKLIHSFCVYAGYSLGYPELSAESSGKRTVVTFGRIERMRCCASLADARAATGRTDSCQRRPGAMW